MSTVDELLEKLIRPAKVLLVEDDVDAAEGFVSWLTGYYECELDWAKRGEDAIQMIERSEKPYDIAFIDLLLPDVSGVEVLRAFKKRMPEVPAVIVTGAASSTLALEAAALGIVGLFSKPVSVDALRNVFNVYKIRMRDKFDSAYFQRKREQPAFF